MAWECGASTESRPRPPLHGSEVDPDASPEERRGEFARFAKVMDLVGFSTRYVGEPGELVVFDLIVNATHTLAVSGPGLQVYVDRLVARHEAGVSMWD